MNTGACRGHTPKGAAQQCRFTKLEAWIFSSLDVKQALICKFVLQVIQDKWYEKESPLHWMCLQNNFQVDCVFLNKD